MRYLPFKGTVILSGTLLVAGLQVRAQDAAAAGGQVAVQAAGAAAGQGRGGRGGFGQMGTPVQGIVTAVGGGKLTIKTDAGDSYAVTVTDSSRIMENRQAIQLSDIKVGDSVAAMGQVDATAKTVQAMMVSATDAATVAKAKENMGKTYITGKITAIDADNLKLTVMRGDSQSQVVVVDDGTSFQRGTRGVTADVVAAGGLAMGPGFGGGRGIGGVRQGGGGPSGGQGVPPTPESITLADIHVGDNVMATGSVKGGVFTVAKMGVQTPGAGGGGRRQGGDPAATPPAGPAPAAPASAAPPQ